MMTDIRTQWTSSKTFRTLIIMALVYAVLRMGIQAILLVDMTSVSVSAPEGQLASDMQVYITAAKNFAAREDLYLHGSLEHIETHYLYSPAFALLFMPILLLSLPVLVSLSVVFHIAAYVLLYLYWGKIFKRLNLIGASQALVKFLPLWILFSAFWDDIAYLNIYIIMALVATLFINAVLQENLVWAVFWLGVIILPIKPQWAFAAALPFVLGRYKFFARLIVGTLVVYLLIAGATILIGGMGYGLQQYADYVAFLARTSRDFPWRGPDKPFLGYNHSIVQTVVYFLGVSPTMMKVATVVKLLLLAPLGFISLRYLTHPLNKRGDEVPRLALDFAFALYLGAFIWLDMVWELSLGIAIFTYLIGSSENKKITNFLWIIFLPYAFVDVWRLFSYIIFGDDILYDGSYVLSDPLLYLPWIMMVLLAFYAVLLWRLNKFNSQESM